MAMQACYITSLLSKSESQDATTRSDDGDTGSFLEPCDDRNCPLHATEQPTDAAQDLLAELINPATGSQISDIVEAARWRRKSGSLENIRQEVLGRTDRTSRHRASSDLPLPIGIMEEVHGVDVSWLHKPNKDSLHRKLTHTRSSSDVKRDVVDSPAAPKATATQGKRPPQPSNSSGIQSQTFPNVTPPTAVEPARDTTHAYSSAPTPSKAQRPSLFTRNSSEKVTQDSGKSGKRASWMNSFSSKTAKLSSAPTQASRSVPSTPPTPTPNTGNDSPAANAAEPKPYVPSKPKESAGSFFSSLRRTISAQSQGGDQRVQGTGGICERRVLNVDPNRVRCNVPEMDPNRLRRVSFCVDVEIAGGPRYRDDEDDADKAQRKKEFKQMARSEGEALKHPEALKEEKDTAGDLARAITPPDKDDVAPDDTEEKALGPEATQEERDAAARKKEKKKQSEIERKERKEKRRKRAEESGAVPVEIPVELELDGEGDDAGAVVNGQAVANGVPASTSPPMQPQPNVNANFPPPTQQERPTTDPVRIYRRCCQLRESPILKRITEQLMNPKCVIPSEAGVVNVLELTGSRLQLADVVTLGDWLAVVPVKQLRLEDADLSDEGIRCILAGLLATKKPEPIRRRSLVPKHRETVRSSPHEERAGVIEKITFKNNPRMSRVGWKYISTFIYMCRSLRAIDLSMNLFPDTLPPSVNSTPVKGPQTPVPSTGEDIDAGEALMQCLSQRLAGDRLEELILSECGLNAINVHHVTKGAINASVNRLGLAGNNLDDEGLEYVLHYLRSGMCQALDIGHNDLRGKLGSIGEAMTVKVNENLPCWGLCLADCNLDTASLKPLFAQLVKLPSFRFIDLSHNRDLCSEDNSLISLLGRYISQLPDLKRIHLVDVSMSPRQAISLANVLPEGPRLAHLNLLENPQLMALANAKTESDQEEACALYASLMAAVRVSGTLICIDIDVPGPENSEVVKALAKQLVAYSLRNMEDFAIAEATDDGMATARATAALTGPHGGEKGVKEFTVPDVLMHLVGHVEGGVSDPQAGDELAPDEDYIVGGTGVVKALQYVLGEKAANEGRRTSTSNGTLTPKERLGSSAGYVEAGRGMKTSKNLLDSARKIRARLQPALVKEAAGQNEVAYRRLTFLDQTLQSIIERFEEEYPETRLTPPSTSSNRSAHSSLTDQSALGTSLNRVDTQVTDLSAAHTDDEEVFSGGEDAYRPDPVRHNSTASLAARAQTMEEGRLHRLGQAMRREVINSPNRGVEFSEMSWGPQTQAQSSNNDKDAAITEDESVRFRKFSQSIENASGVDLKALVEEVGWNSAIQSFGGNVNDLRLLQEEDPEAWELFKEAQMKARLNMEGSS